MLYSKCSAWLNGLGCSTGCNTFQDLTLRHWHLNDDGNKQFLFQGKRFGSKYIGDFFRGKIDGCGTITIGEIKASVKSVKLLK